MIQYQVYQSEAIEPLELPELSQLLEMVATDFAVSGKLSIAVLSDAEIREINRRHLNHDYETDCISFDLSENDEELEGEVVISADTARRIAQQINWNPSHEATLYILHGVLHILGFDDDTVEAKAEMRLQEREYLRKLGVPGWKSHPTHGDADVETSSEPVDLETRRLSEGFDNTPR
jgi:probable rRNA maturation factor